MSRCFVGIGIARHDSLTQNDSGGQKFPGADAEHFHVEAPLSQCGFGGSRGPHGCCAQASFLQLLALDTTFPGLFVKLGEIALLGVSQGFKEATASKAMQEAWAITVGG